MKKGLNDLKRKLTGIFIKKNKATFLMNTKKTLFAKIGGAFINSTLLLLLGVSSVLMILLIMIGVLGEAKSLEVPDFIYLMISFLGFLPLGFSMSEYFKKIKKIKNENLDYIEKNIINKMLIGNKKTKKYKEIMKMIKKDERKNNKITFIYDEFDSNNNKEGFSFDPQKSSYFLNVLSDIKMEQEDIDFFIREIKEKYSEENLNIVFNDEVMLYLTKKNKVGTYHYFYELIEVLNNLDEKSVVKLEDFQKRVILDQKYKDENVLKNSFKSKKNEVININ